MPGEIQTLLGGTEEERLSILIIIKHSVIVLGPGGAICQAIRPSQALWGSHWGQWCFRAASSPKWGRGKGLPHFLQGQEAPRQEGKVALSSSVESGPGDIFGHGLGWGGRWGPHLAKLGGITLRYPRCTTAEDWGVPGGGAASVKTR